MLVIKSLFLYILLETSGKSIFKFSFPDLSFFLKIILLGRPHSCIRGPVFTRRLKPSGRAAKRAYKLARRCVPIARPSPSFFTKASTFLNGNELVQIARGWKRRRKRHLTPCPVLLRIHWAGVVTRGSGGI